MLVVVDMQKQFSASNNAETIDNVSNLINNTMILGDYIVFLEYLKYGPTHPELLKLVQDYSRTATTYKITDGGGKEVIDCINLFSPVYLTEKNKNLVINICGVNTCACVRQTSEDLAEQLPHSMVNVNLKACNDSIYKDEKQSLSWYRPLENINFIGKKDA
jgi:nicotinamidase-related amidase